jgi:tetratricopeptide (TPR) repeat protein
LRLPSLQTGNWRYAWVPYLTVLIWLVHPAQTESVTYIVQRMTCLAAMFYVLSLWLYVMARLSDRHGRKILLYAGCILAGGLGFGSKQITATLPLFILLYEWYFFQDLSRVWLKRNVLPIAGVLIIIGTLSLIYLGLNPIEQILALYENRDFTPGQRMLTQFRVVIFYISLIIFPHPSRLNLDRGFPISNSIFNPITTVVCLAVIIILIGLAIYSARRQRLLSFAILWFLGNLAIESSIIGLEIIFDHRTYLPSMFVIFIGVLLIQRYVRPKIAGFIFLGVTALMFSIWTHERNGTWNDEVTLWQDCVNKSPEKARPHNNLGRFLGQRGRYDEALHQYSEALRIKPDYPEAHNNMCTVLYNQDRLQEALMHCTTALRLKPVNADAHSNLGMILAKQGKLEEALRHYSEALRIKPGHANAHNNLGDAFARQGKHKEAIHHFSEALRLNPDFAKAQFGLGRSFQKLGQLDEAVGHFSRATQIQPDFYQAYYRLGNTFRQQKKMNNAIRSYLRAIEIKPDFAPVQNNLGTAFGMQGKYREAVKHLSEAVRLKPSSADYHFNLANALTGQGKHREALDHYSKAAGLNPFDAELQQALKRAEKSASRSGNN